MRAKINETSMTLNGVDRAQRQRTYVTLGTRRGGTSMVAGIIRALGVDLGRIGALKHNEDPEFQNKAIADMREAITRRNTERDVWGWKFPAAGSYLPVLVKSIRNPFFIVVFRDPVAAAMSQLRKDRDVSRRSPRVSLHESNANANTNTGFAMATTRPCLMVSFEKAKDKPHALIDELADFLFVEHPDDELRSRILDYSSPGQYKTFDDFFGSGGSADGDGRVRDLLGQRQTRSVT